MAVLAVLPRSVWPPRPDLIWDANNRVVTPGYFEAMRIPGLRRGRLFRDADGPNAPPVAIINETMARKFWAGSGCAW